VDSNGLETKAGVDFLSSQIEEFATDAANDAAGIQAFQTNYISALNASQTAQNTLLNNSYALEVQHLTDQFDAAQDHLVGVPNGLIPTEGAAVSAHITKAFGDAHSQTNPLCVLQSVYTSSGGATVGYNVIVIPTRLGRSKVCLYMPASVAQGGAIPPSNGSNTDFSVPCYCGVSSTKPVAA